MISAFTPCAFKRAGFRDSHRRNAYQIYTKVLATPPEYIVHAFEAKSFVIYTLQLDSIQIFSYTPIGMSPSQPARRFVKQWNRSTKIKMALL